MKPSWMKNTAVFLASQAVSIFGSSLVQYAITWYITLSTKSGVYATLAIVCGILPTFFLSPFAGVWADRYDRKKLIIIADGGIALCTLVIAIAFMMGQGAIWLLLVALAVRGFGSAVQSPAIGAMLPDIVPEEHLARVNGVNSSLQSLITLASPMLSGALLGFAPLQIIFFIDVATAALAIVVLLLFFKLPQGEKPRTSAPGTYVAELKQGFSYIGKNRYLRNFFIFCVVFFFMAAPVAFLTPLQVARNYGDDVWRLTAIEVAFSVGMMAGGLLMASWGGLKNRVYTMAIAGLVMGVCTIALGLPVRFWLYIGLMGLFGLAMPLYQTPSMVLLQEKVDPAYLGRVFGVMTMLNSGMMPAGMLVFGPLADRMPIEWLLLGTGAVILLAAVVLLRNKPLLQAGVKAPKSPQAE